MISLTIPISRDTSINSIFMRGGIDHGLMFHHTVGVSVGEPRYQLLKRPNNALSAVHPSTAFNGAMKSLIEQQKMMKMEDADADGNKLVNNER